MGVLGTGLGLHAAVSWGRQWDPGDRKGVLGTGMQLLGFRGCRQASGAGAPGGGWGSPPPPPVSAVFALRLPRGWRGGVWGGDGGEARGWKGGRGAVGRKKTLGPQL